MLIIIVMAVVSALFFMIGVTAHYDSTAINLGIVWAATTIFLTVGYLRYR